MTYLYVARVMHDVQEQRPTVFRAIFFKLLFNKQLLHLVFAGALVISGKIKVFLVMC